MLVKSKADGWLYSAKWMAISLMVAMLVTFAVSKMGMSIGVLVIGLGFGVPIMFMTLRYLHLGVFLTFITSFFILGILRFTDMPLGTLMDGLFFLYLLAMFVHVGRDGDWSFANNRVGLLILLWIAYNIFQVANPFAESRLAWVFTIRGMAGAMVFYFICSYALKKYSHANFFIQLWVFLAFLLACYGVVQEFRGLHPIEENWVRADEGRFALYYNWGKFRKFSFFSDPMTYGITCAYTSVLCLVLALGPRSLFWKGFYFFCTLLMTVGMVFSGTRTAFVLLPIGVVFLTILTLNRTFIAFSVLFFSLGAGIIFSPIKSLGPIDANSLERIRSAFMPGDDPSFQVRIKNQAFIKPFILSHPIGAGLGSIGVWGQRFSPWSPIANFPPDSGFVRIAVELGWVGLILYSYMLFEVMRLGIKNYHLIRDPIIKNTQAALLSCMFTLIVANYAQEAITMYPTSVIFYTAMALTTLMPKFDRHEKIL